MTGDVTDHEQLDVARLGPPADQPAAGTAPAMPVEDRTFGAVVHSFDPGPIDQDPASVHVAIDREHFAASSVQSN
jgi:hypothetical protein